MGCACYDEGYDDGVHDTEKSHTSETMILNWTSVEKLSDLIWTNPWILEKVSQIFERNGFQITKKPLVR